MSQIPDQELALFGNLRFFVGSFLDARRFRPNSVRRASVRFWVIRYFHVLLIGR
jgi:hypothetical protein